MFGAPLVRATIMHQHQRRPSASSLPSSSAVHAAIMANSGSNKSSNGRTTQDSTSAVTAAKPKSKYADVDPQMFVDSPFVGGAMLSLESASAQPKNKASADFNLKYFNPSSDPRLLAM